MLVEQSRRQFHFHRFFVEQVDELRRGDLRPSHQLDRSLPQATAGLDLIWTGVRVLHQGGGYPDFAQQLLRCALTQFGRNLANLSD